jgi:Lon protease-like protein
MERPRSSADGQGPRCIAPLFPLPNFFLFPRSLAPLHIFEPRYRQMIEDLLDGNGRVVMGTVPHAYAGELACKPPVHPVAGLGEIVRHERLPDGRYLVWLFGVARVRVREVESTRLYRCVACEPFVETPLAAERAGLVRCELERAILNRTREFLNLPEELPTDSLVDILLQRLQLSCDTLARLYGEPDLELRARGALAEHARHPPPNGNLPKTQTG